MRCFKWLVAAAFPAIVSSGCSDNPASPDAPTPASARVAVTTIGLDIDPDGYTLLVDGSPRGAIPVTGTVVTLLDPGSRTIALTGLAGNCTADGPGARTVTVVAAEVVSIEVAVVCTATSGVIGVVVRASGTDVEGRYEAMVDSASPLSLVPGQAAYWSGVPAGDYVVSLPIVPDNCSVETDPQTATVTVGELIRDTVEVVISVTCAPREASGNLRITAPTTGPVPNSTRYEVWYEHYGYWDYGGSWTFLGDLDPNGTLGATVAASTWSGADPYWYSFQLRGIPANCSAEDPHPYPAPGFTITYGDVLDIEFRVTCSP